VSILHLEYADALGTRTTEEKHDEHVMWWRKRFEKRSKLWRYLFLFGLLLLHPSLDTPRSNEDDGDDESGA